MNYFCKVVLLLAAPLLFDISLSYSAGDSFHLVSPIKFKEATLSGWVTKQDLQTALGTYNTLPTVPLRLMYKGDPENDVYITSCKDFRHYIDLGWYPNSIGDINLTGAYIKTCNVCKTLLKAKSLDLKPGERLFSFTDNILKLTVGSLPTKNEIYLEDFLSELDPLMTLEELIQKDIVKVEKISPSKIKLIFEDTGYTILTEVATADFHTGRPFNTLVIAYSASFKGALQITDLFYYYPDPETGLIFYDRKRRD